MAATVHSPVHNHKSPSPPTDNDTHPQRPPPHPPVKRSNLDLEQNPFEMSFSRPSDSSSDDSPSAENKNPPAETPKPTLPPLSSIAQAQEGSSFPWGFTSSDMTGSLRSGPLSPAMLVGPRNQPATTAPTAQATTTYTRPQGPLGPLAFDSSTSFIRTGLTPDVGRTGLTPLVGGPASFPPPSPNTAAFLAMVTNNANGTSLANAATITPNTLSALTGVVLNPSTSATATTSNPSANSEPHPLSVSHAPSYQPSYQSNDRPTNTDYASSAQNAANAAANGLFLLSQAHQELSKREEAQAAAAAAAASGTTTRGAAKRGATVNNINGEQLVPNGKRKSLDAPPQTKNPISKRPRGATTNSNTSPTHSRPAARRKSMTEDILSNEDDMSMDEDEEHEAMATQSSSKGHKKPETEEEKRKNFLERNRQAALKCRQRKKAWLTSLQQKVEFLQAENERLQTTIVSMRDEVTRLSAVVVAHRDCGLGGVIVPGHAAAGMIHSTSAGLAHPSLAHGPGGATMHAHHNHHNGPNVPPSTAANPSNSSVVQQNGQSGAPLSVSVSVPPPVSSNSNGVTAASGYGY